jgi:hypothetical protein
MTTLLDAFGRPHVEIDEERGVVTQLGGFEVIHPQREQGREAGRASCGKDETFALMVEAALGCVLDETMPERTREKSGEYCLGFAEGWAEMMAVAPLKFLTRLQTARVNSLPRRIRLMWLSEYRKGVKRWRKKGGRPVLPEIP